MVSMLADVFSYLDSELVVIKQAPFSFIVALVLASGIVWIVIHFLYTHSIKAKDATIETLRASLETERPRHLTRNNASRLSKLKTANLDVRGPELYQDHLTVAKRWRMIVHNRGPDAAGNVLMRLRSIDPNPRYWCADYPYPVRRTSASARDQLSGCKINPNDEDTYEVVAGWRIEAGKFYTEGLDTKRERNLIRIDPDERWELKYEVMAENATPVSFSLIMCVKDGAVLVERKN